MLNSKGARVTPISLPGTDCVDLSCKDHDTCYANNCISPWEHINPLKKIWDQLSEK
jgi:hypothetical protein